MANTKNVYSSHTLLSHQLFSDSATQYFCWLPSERTTLGACASKEVDRVEHTNRLHHPDGCTWPPRTFSSCSALVRSFSRREGLAHPQPQRRRIVMIPWIVAWRPPLSMPLSKESSWFFFVEAVALPNLPQTFRGRERSKKGYASHPLTLVPDDNVSASTMHV